jgi:hypothetical protein
MMEPWATNALGMDDEPVWEKPRVGHLVTAAGAFELISSTMPRLNHSPCSLLRPTTMHPRIHLQRSLAPRVNTIQTHIILILNNLRMALQVKRTHRFRLRSTRATICSNHSTVRHRGTSHTQTTVWVLEQPLSVWVWE